MPPFFSIVIPLYNKAGTIARTMSSVFQQWCNDFEIIVVDDGSKDEGPSIINGFDDNRIRLIRQSNGGVSMARNHGIQVAQGEFIAFLDADDIWDPEYLSTIKALIDKYPGCVMAATSYYLGFSDGSKKEIRLNGIDFNECGILENYFEVAAISSPPVWTSAVCIRKDILAISGGFPTGIKSGEDLLTWAKTALQGQIAYCRKPLATFTQDSAHTYDSLPSRVPEKEDPVGLELRKLLSRCPPHQKSGLKKYISAWHKMRASVFLRFGKNIPAFKEIIILLYFNPYNMKGLIYFAGLFIPKRYRNRIFKKFSSDFN